MTDSRISFRGAAREVTGSCHLLEWAGRALLLDCGLYQGGRERHERNREPFPFPVAGLEAVVLSHAHIDHSGRLPLLVGAGFSGPIWCTEATGALCEIMLRDSAHLQEEDARWKVRRLEQRGQDASWVEPLYTTADAERTLELLRPVGFDEAVEVFPGVEVRFVPAGHILGAAIVDLTLDDGDERRRLVFSGDLGVDGARLMGAPRTVECPDWLVLESTYGDTDRDDRADLTEELRGIIADTAARGGKVIIPAFAVGRTQEILARLNDLVEADRLPDVPVYLDSPMAVKATRVFRQFPDSYSERARELLERGDAPLRFPGLELVTEVEDSKAINDDPRPGVIISASGMCDGGRVKHHLKNHLGDNRTTVLFVGYQAPSSLGRVIQSGVSPVRIFGEHYPVRARIETLHGFSAHADRGGLQAWFAGLGGPPRRTFVVHGDEEAALALAGSLASEHGAEVTVPRRHETYPLA